MQRQRIRAFTPFVALVVSLLFAGIAGANPPAPANLHSAGEAGVVLPLPPTAFPKPIDQPNLPDFRRNRDRQQLLASGQYLEAQALALTGEERVLVILVEFGGPDVVTWQPGDTWDPIGRIDPNEAVYDEYGQVATGDCSKIITQTTTFRFSGPLRNQIPRPVSAADESGNTIWTEDFGKGWFESLLWGDGVKFDYTRQDGSVVREDFAGESVRDYFLDMSGGRQRISGDVIGWVKVPHSTQWYGTDACPGRRSSDPGVAVESGGIPNAGDNRSFVVDSLAAVNAISNTIPGFSWTNYDRDHDGVIDRLWIAHAGYGEDENATLLNRTEYGEGSLWSQSGALAPPHPVAAGIAAGPYLIMPENGGIGVFAHEHAHSLGAIDLHSAGGGASSAGFWTPMADDWTGYPAGFEPPAVDPLHLDLWGWLQPLVIKDATREYVFKLGQASRFPGGDGVYRGAKIELPDGGMNLPVPLWQGARYWWGGNEELANATMTTRTSLFLPPGGAKLAFETAYGMEAGSDFLWVQISVDGATWTTLTNANTTCEHLAGWTGAANGFPDDLCAAGIGGFTGYNRSYPAPDAQEFDLTGFAGQRIYLRFWHMTGAGAPLEGPFVDSIKVTVNDTVPLVDDAEGPGDKWRYDGGWLASNGSHVFTQNYYLQWRNVSATGGYDSALGDPRSPYGPANSGLLVWHNNNYYADNEIGRYLKDYPGFGSKGRMLVVDAHSQPYRDPDVIGAGYLNEAANLPSRGQMRDAPFSLRDTVPFRYPSMMPGSTQWIEYAGRPAARAFHDSYGYYPGAEFVNRGPAYPSSLPKWLTRQWDASVVLPARAPYGLNAPNLRIDSPVYYNCQPHLSGPTSGRLSCYLYSYGLGYEGGTGNPGDLLAQYGWHVEILDQTAEVATLRVWNSQKAFAGAVTQTASSAPAVRGSTVRVDISTTNVGSPATGLFIAPLDDEEAYLEGSAYGGAFPVTAAQAAALAPGAIKTAQSGASAGEVVAVAASLKLATAGAARFGFSTRITSDRGEIHHAVAVFEGSTFLNEFDGAALPVGEAKETVTEQFPAAADTHISVGIPRANFGKSPFIYVGGNDVLRSLLRFDLSAIDRRYPVDAATLWLYVHSFGGGGSPASLAAYRVTAHWQETTATWKSPWTAAGGDVDSLPGGLTPVTKAAAGKWVGVDVTEMARDWVERPDANDGVLLRLIDATSYTTYRLVSKDNGWMAGEAPRLQVTYRKP